MENLEETAINIILPVLEAAVVYASYYCKACGRTTITGKDMEYGLKHSAMTTVGKHIGTHFPEDDEDAQCSSDEDDSIEVIDDEEEPFTRYSGTEELYLQMNESFDNWDSWEPQSPAEHAIKNAVDKQKEDGRVFP